MASKSGRAAQRNPASLGDAIGITNEACILTTSKPPYPVVHSNKAWSEITGYKFHEIAGKTCSFLQGPETEKAALQVLHTALSQQQPCQTILTNYRRDGTPFTNIISCEPVQGGMYIWGKIKSLPITDGSVQPLPRSPAEIEREPLAPLSYAKPENYEHSAKRVQRHANKVRLDDIFANTTDPMVLCAKDPPHVITHPNQAWLEMCGYSLEEVEGLTNKVLTGAETDATCIEDLLDCVKKLEPSCQTVVNYKKGGLRFVNQVKTLPVYDENDALAAFVSMLHEVDEDCLLVDDMCNPGETHLWVALEQRLDMHSPLTCSGVGAAAKHPAAAREEAARKLIGNHDAILADATAEGFPRTQPGMKRLSCLIRPYADQAMREVARRLLGHAAAGILEERLSADHPMLTAQQTAWIQLVEYLDARLQTDPHPSGRAPDMSRSAASAFRSILREVGTMARGYT